MNLGTEIPTLEKSTASSIIPDPKKRILELKNPKQNMLPLPQGCIHPRTPQQLVQAALVPVSSIPSQLPFFEPPVLPDALLSCSWDHLQK
jgi:hypothetical protein